MAIKQLEIQRLRNLKNVKIEPVPGFNYLFGDNGSGKTSLLESIHCLGRGKSFRTHQTTKLIQEGSDSFTIVGKIIQKGRETTIGMERSCQGSQIHLSNHPIKSTAELAEWLPIALLEPGLHRLIEEGPEFRRKFLDWGVFHVEPGYGGAWKSYRRALEQRNAALRDRWARKAIEQWDKELGRTAQDLDQARRRYMESLLSAIQNIELIYDALPEVEFSYHCGWKEGIHYPEYLASQYDSDRERGFTQFGPHRADLKIRIGGVDAKDVLSRGQQKLLVATLILAQCRQLSQQDTSTVILVDDLPAELDPDKRQALLNALSKTRAQVFVTATEKALFKGTDFNDAGVFHVEQGQVTRRF